MIVNFGALKTAHVSQFCFVRWDVLSYFHCVVVSYCSGGHCWTKAVQVHPHLHKLFLLRQEVGLTMFSKSCQDMNFKKNTKKLVVGWKQLV